MAKPTICMSSRHQKTPCFLWTPTLTSYAFDPFANIQKFPEKTTTATTAAIAISTGKILRQSNFFPNSIKSYKKRILAK